MATLKNTIKHHVRILVIKKTVFLICLTVALVLLSYFSSSKAIVTGSANSRFLYILGSVIVTLGVLILVAWKIRYFHNLLGRDWTGTVIRTGNVDVGTRWNKDNIRGVSSFVVTVQLENSKKKKKLSFNSSKISPSVYSVGDRIYFIKGTRYPINLTREEAQHICPMCARDSCYGDWCPDCDLKY